MRGKIGHLSGPNEPKTRMLEYIGTKPMHTRDEEPSTTPYGDNRAKAIAKQIADRLDDDDADDDAADDDASVT